MTGLGIFLPEDGADAIDELAMALFAGFEGEVLGGGLFLDDPGVDGDREADGEKGERDSKEERILNYRDLHWLLLIVLIGRRWGGISRGRTSTERRMGCAARSSYAAKGRLSNPEARRASYCAPFPPGHPAWKDPQALSPRSICRAAARVRAIASSGRAK